MTIAFLAHLYTAAGAVLAFLAATAVVGHDYRAAFFWLYLQVAVDATDDRLLGSFSLMEVDRERGSGEIGYWVAADARGRGIATRATRLLADWARNEQAIKPVSTTLRSRA